MSGHDERKTVLAIGETLWDLLPAGPRLGGAPFNFAFRVHSLGDRTLIASRLGQDDLGRKAAEHITSLGMDTSLVQWDKSRPTGTVRVTLDPRGNPDFHIVPEVAYDALEATPQLLEWAVKADCICFGTLIQRTTPARDALKQVLSLSPGSKKFLDINLRKECYTRETIVASLEQADVLKLNAPEAQQLARLFTMTAGSLPEVCSRLIDQWALECCVVTLGEQGVFAASSEGDKVYLPGYAVEVADTCGSGDALSAGFVHEYLRRRPLSECCESGNALGAMVATQPGATTPISRADLGAFHQAKHRRVYDPELKDYNVD